LRFKITSPSTKAPSFGCLHEKPYFFAMKHLLGFIFLAGIISCNNTETTSSSTTSSIPKLKPRDSALAKGEVANPYVPIDVSPMDMAWLPVDYPKLITRKSLPVARIIYSRPHKQGRKIFGNLVKYGERWRLGANEATEIEFFIPVTIQDKTIPRGRYILYCIPEMNSWTIVFNSNLNSWGLTLDPSKDLYRFSIPAQVKNQSVEYFSMTFQPNPQGADLVMAWDDVEARLAIQYKQK
jgi:hypothetical protein